jgi:hypothetical protein
MLRYRSTSSSSRDTVDEDPCFVSKMNFHNNVQKHLDGLLATHTITSRRSWEKAAERFTLFKKGSYHSLRIILILLHTFAKGLLALLNSTFL